MSYTFIGSIQASDITGSPSLTHGLTIAEDDLIVVCIHSNNDAGTIADTTGSGAAFTAAYDSVDYGDTSCYSMLWKNANASEPATYTFSHGASGRWGITLHQFRPSSGTSAEDAKTNGSTASASTGVVAGITVADNTVAVAMVCRDRNEITTPSVDNSYLGVTDAEEQKCVSAYRLFTTGGATGDVTFSSLGADDETGYAHVSFALASVGPTITDVNTTESWTDGDTGLVITGTNFI